MHMMPPGGLRHIGWRLIYRSVWKGNSANFAYTEFSEAHLITFNTNITHLGDALLAVEGVWCKCYVAK
jgi:hypothetical protein